MARGLRNATQEIEFRDVSARSIVPSSATSVARRDRVRVGRARTDRGAKPWRPPWRDQRPAGRHGGARFDRGRGRGHRRPRQGARAVPVPRCGPQRGIGGGGASVGVRRRRDARRPDEVDREQRLGRVRPERGGARVRLPRERRRVAGARPGHPELLVLALRHRQRGRGRRRRPRRDQGRVDALRPPAVLGALPTRPRTRWSGRSLPRAGAASQPRVARCSRFWRRSPTTASPAS